MLTFLEWFSFLNEDIADIKQLLRQRFTSLGAPDLVFEEIWDEIASIQKLILNRQEGTDEQKAEILMHLPEISNMAKLKWTPEPVIIDISPLDLAKRSLNQLVETEFGDNPHPEVEESPARTARARQYVQLPLEQILPVVLVHEGGKYRILAGHHRIAAWMLRVAPTDRNLRKWPKTKIRAYIGKYW